MRESLSYCPNWEYVAPRLDELFGERSQEIVLARMNVPSPAIADFMRTHKAGFCEYPDPEERIAFWDAYAKEHIPVFDDSVPSAYLSEMDQGLYGGLFDGDVRFLCDPHMGWISSMVSPLLHDWSEFEKLSFSTYHQWYKRYVNQLEVFSEGSRGKFGVGHFIMINGLNFVFELVGATNTYLGLVECPEMIAKAVDLAHEVNLKIHKTFFDKVPNVDGGTFSYYAQWLPGQIVAESVDPFHMTSVDCFEQWGRAPVEKIFAEFEGGVIHIHGNGRHLLEAVSTVRGLKAVWLGDDTGYPSAFSVLDVLKKKVGDLPVVCLTKYPEFCQALKEHTLVGGVLYDVCDVPDVDAANRCMDSVRRSCM